MRAVWGITLPLNINVKPPKGFFKVKLKAENVITLHCTALPSNAQFMMHIAAYILPGGDVHHVEELPSHTVHHAPAHWPGRKSTLVSLLTHSLH